MLRRLLLMFVAMVLGVHPAAAGPFVVDYGFSGLSGVSSPTSVAPQANTLDATFGNLVRGPGIVPEAEADQFNGSGWSTSSTPPPNASTDYFEWSITPVPGFLLDVDRIIFWEDADDSLGLDGPTLWALRSSSDGFLTSTVLFSGLATHTTPFLQTLNDLGTLGLTDISTPLTFRLYGYGAEPGIGGAPGEWALGDGTDTLANRLRVTGDLSPVGVPVPEPLSLVLLGTGLLGVRIRRRRREI